MDARKYLQEVTELYDSILLDAPCSAEGRISLQNEKSYGFWSLENIEKKPELQYDLLSLAWNHLRSGGSLVYSTCTLAPEENE
jgi:tRNA (cytosine49-C5)-methyltransferase